MYSIRHQAFHYMLHLLRSRGSKGHGVHSPFVFDFLIRVLRDPRKDRHEFSGIEQDRKRWLGEKKAVQVEDLGAGSSADKGNTRTLSSIAKNAAKPPRFGRLFFRMIRHYHIDSVLELGTSLGLTTRYFSLANPPSGVITIEGSQAIAAHASAGFSAAALTNVHTITGNFDHCLPEALGMLKGKKLIFFDGNHQYEPTLRYFRQALEQSGPDDIFIFDDIHWSAEMERAWSEIKKNQEVRCSLDLYFIGIVFFKKEFKEKLDFSIRF
jgi:predicted O-methyltransferase YrrM